MKKLLVRSLLLSALSVNATFTLAQETPRPTSRTNAPQRQTELTVKVTFENDRPVQSPIRVQLMNHMGVPVTETFSRDGEARFPGISPGTYRLKATSPDIEDTVTDQAFTVTNWDTVRFEFLRVKRKVVPGEEQGSTDGHVSMAMLNIPDKARREFDKGLEQLEKKNLPEAQKRFEKAVSIYPKYAAALNNLGYLAMTNGDSATGESYFQQAIAADEQYPGAYVNLAKLRWGQKRFPEAEKLLQKHTSLDPKNVEVITLLANANAMNGRHDEALAYVKKVHSLPHENFAVVHYIAGMSFVARNQFQDAALEYRQYLKESPQGPIADKARMALQNVEQKLAAK